MGTDREIFQVTSGPLNGKWLEFSARESGDVSEWLVLDRTVAPIWLVAAEQGYKWSTTNYMSVLVHEKTLYLQVPFGKGWQQRVFRQVSDETEAFQIWAAMAYDARSFVYGYWNIREGK